MGTLTHKIENLRLNSIPQHPRRPAFHKRECYHCGRSNHESRNCWFKRPQTSPRYDQNPSHPHRREVNRKVDSAYYRDNTGQRPPAKQPYRNSLDTFPNRNEARTLPKQRYDLNYRGNR